MASLVMIRCYRSPELPLYTALPASQQQTALAIEIYDLNNVQLWRNLRSSEKMVECISKVSALLSGETPEIFYSEIEPHALEETCSAERLILDVHHEIFCRLKSRDEKQLAAWLVMSNAKIMGKGEVKTSPTLRVLGSKSGSWVNL